MLLQKNYQLIELHFMGNAQNDMDVKHMLCFIRAEYNGKTEFLYLPCEEEAIDKAFARLGAPTPDDVELSWEDICKPPFRGMKKAIRYNKLHKKENTKKKT